MPNERGLINHGPDILRDMRRDTWANRLRYITADLKYRIRLGMVMVYVLGIGFAVGFFAGVAIS